MAIEKQIGCCGAAKWTRGIAIFQIVENALLLILRIALVIIVILAVKEAKEKRQSYTLTINFWVVAIQFSTPVVGIIMAVLLRRGSNQRRVDYLKIWIIYAIVCLAFVVISMILDYYWVNIVLGVLIIVTNIFCIIVVNIHRKEILLGVIA